MPASFESPHSVNPCGDPVPCLTDVSGGTSNVKTLKHPDAHNLQDGDDKIKRCCFSLRQGRTTCQSDIDKRETLYSFLVLLTSCILQAISVGMAFSAGAFFVDWLEAFDSVKTETSWVGSINIASVFLAAPISSMLTMRFGHRKVVIVGSVLASLGLVASGLLATRIYHLYLTYGATTGIGFSLMYVPSVSIVGFYFNKHRPLAMGISAAGMGVGTLVIPSLYRYLVSIYGWRGALVSSAGITLQGCVLAAVFRTPRSACASLALGLHKTWRRVFSVEVLKGRRLPLMFVNNFLWGLGSIILTVLVGDYASDVGLNQDQGSRLVSLIGLSSIIGRLVAAVAGNVMQSPKLHIFNIGSLLRGVSMVFYPLKSTFTALLSFSLLHGLGFGLQLGSLAVTVTEIFGLDNFTGALGYLMIATGLGSLAGPPIAGCLYSVRDDYAIPLYLGGATTILSIVPTLLLPRRRPPVSDLLTLEVNNPVVVLKQVTSNKGTTDETAISVVRLP